MEPTQKQLGDLLSGDRKFSQKGKQSTPKNDMFTRVWNAYPKIITERDRYHSALEHYKKRCAELQSQHDEHYRHSYVSGMSAHDWFRAWLKYGSLKNVAQHYNVNRSWVGHHLKKQDRPTYDRIAHLMATERNVHRRKRPPHQLERACHDMPYILKGIHKYGSLSSFARHNQKYGYHILHDALEHEHIKSW